MKVVFRADASLQIGTGHVMRCLTLAGALREQGATCIFVCRAHAGHFAEQIKMAGFDVCLLPRADDFQPQAGDDDYARWLGCSQAQDAEQTMSVLGDGCDWLVVDHYGLDASWEQALRGKAERIFVIDDLANRPYDCNLLLDQNLGRQASDYTGLVSVACTRLIGPEYALLRPEFAALREYSLKRREKPQLGTLLVSMGGVDSHDATSRVLGALVSCPLPSDCRIIVVMGQYAPWLEQVRVQAATFSFPCEVKVNVNNMAELMGNSDLVIGGSGSTAWERCCLGLPSISLVLAENQRAIAMALDKQGATLMVSSVTQLPAAIAALSAGGNLQCMSELASQLVDGQGCHRVVTAMDVVS